MNRVTAKSDFGNIPGKEKFEGKSRQEGGKKAVHPMKEVGAWDEGQELPAAVEAILNHIPLGKATRHKLFNDEEIERSYDSADSLAERVIGVIGATGASAPDVRRLLQLVRGKGEKGSLSLRQAIKGKTTPSAAIAGAARCGECNTPNDADLFLLALDKRLVEWLSADTQRKKEEANEAGRKALAETNPYTGDYHEQYAAAKTRELYAPAAQTKAVIELWATPCTERNAKPDKNGDLKIAAQRGVSFLVKADKDKDGKPVPVDINENKFFSARLTLAFLLIEIPRQKDSIDPNRPELTSSVRRFAGLRGLIDIRNARLILVRDLDTLIHTTVPLESKGKVLFGEKYTILQKRNVPQRGDKFSAMFSAPFYDTLMKNFKNLMPFPLELLKLNPEYDGLALICGIKAAFNQFYFYGEKRGERGVTAADIAKYAEPLLPSEEKLRTGGRHYTQQRVEPLFTAAKRLGKALGSTAPDMDFYKDDGTDEPPCAEAGDDFNAVRLMCNWNNYPDISAERKESRDRRDRAKKGKAGKSETTNAQK